MKYFIYCRKSTESEDRQILSIDSQYQELQSKFSGDPEVQIAEVFRESFSAKAPGRPIFEDMLVRIERGEAAGIIAWHPDRLARNAVDGGRIIHLLDRKVLQDLKFATSSFENNSQGKFMLSIIFGYSKYYVDSLSENVKRGMRAKLQRGWHPNHAPIGYRNDPVSRTIIKDPERFTLVRKLFDLALTGTYSLRRLNLEAREWGLKTVKRKRTGGKYLSVGNVHHVLTSPFYSGTIKWAGQNYPGAHEPMITLEEFEQVRRHLSRNRKLPPKKHVFPFRGLIRCGQCGLSVTAEDKVNRYGRQYTYYHCTKRRIGSQCTERSIAGRALDDTYLAFLQELTIPESLHQWTLREIAKAEGSRVVEKADQEQALKRADADVLRALNNLISLRIRDLMGDEEYATQRKALLEEQGRIRERLARVAQGDQWFEPARRIFSFNNRAVSWFVAGDTETKWHIVCTTGSNLSLRDKILSIEAREPFVLLSKNADRPTVSGALDRFRTLYNTRDPELLQTLSIIELLEKKHRNRDDLPKAA